MKGVVQLDPCTGLDSGMTVGIESRLKDECRLRECER